MQIRKGSFLHKLTVLGNPKEHVEELGHLWGHCEVLHENSINTLYIQEIQSVQYLLMYPY